MNMELIISISLGVLFVLILNDGLNCIIDQYIKFTNTETGFNEYYKKKDNYNRLGVVMEIRKKKIPLKLVE